MYGGRSLRERKWGWAACSAKSFVRRRLVATEKFDDSWYPGEAVDTTVFEERGGVTKVRLTVLLRVEGSSRHRNPVRHGTWHGRGLQPARAGVGVIERQQVMREVGMLLVDQRSNQRSVDGGLGRRLRPDRHGAHYH